MRLSFEDKPDACFAGQQFAADRAPFFSWSAKFLLLISYPPHIVSADLHKNPEPALFIFSAMRPINSLQQDSNLIWDIPLYNTVVSMAPSVSWSLNVTGAGSCPRSCRPATSSSEQKNASIAIQDRSDREDREVLIDSTVLPRSASGGHRITHWLCAFRQRRTLQQCRLNVRIPLTGSIRKDETWLVTLGWYHFSYAFSYRAGIFVGSMVRMRGALANWYR